MATYTEVPVGGCFASTRAVSNFVYSTKGTSGALVGGLAPRTVIWYINGLGGALAGKRADYNVIKSFVSVGG